MNAARKVRIKLWVCNQASTLDATLDILEAAGWELGQFVEVNATPEGLAFFHDQVFLLVREGVYDVGWGDVDLYSNRNVRRPALVCFHEEQPRGIGDMINACMSGDGTWCHHALMHLNPEFSEAIE